MGGATPAGSERASDASTDLRPGAIFPGACGQCLEDDHPGVCIQLGCGHKPWNGWINVDGERASDRADVVSDLRRLPFADGYADVMVAIHVLEHFYEWEAADVLREWQRVLKPGGLLVLELPSMDKIIVYLIDCLQKQGGKINMQMSWWGMYGDPRYQDPVMVHRWGYTKQMLRSLLETVGFVSVQAEAPRYHVKMRDMRMTARKESLCPSMS